MTTQNAPGLYSNGTVTRRANSPAEAVRLQFDGFVPVDTSTDTSGASYRDLQKRAGELGIKANQSAEDLSAAIADAEANGPATDNSSALDEVETTTDNS